MNQFFKLFGKVFLGAYIFTFLTFFCLRYNADISLGRMIMVELAGALGFVLNPILLLILVGFTFTIRGLIKLSFRKSPI
jgi:hypothetical protein